MKLDAAKAKAASATATPDHLGAEAVPSRPKGTTKEVKNITPEKKLRLFIYVQFSPYTKIVRTVLRTSH